MYELVSRDPYGIPRQRLPTAPELQHAYDAAQRRLQRYKVRDTSKTYHVMFDVLGQIIHPFQRDKRPTLDSIVNALQQNQSSLLQYEQDISSICK